MCPSWVQCLQIDVNHKMCYYKSIKVFAVNFYRDYICVNSQLYNASLLLFCFTFQSTFNNKSAKCQAEVTILFIVKLFSWFLRFRLHIVLSNQTFTRKILSEFPSSLSVFFNSFINLILLKEMKIVACSVALGDS